MELKTFNTIETNTFFDQDSIIISLLAEPPSFAREIKLKKLVWNHFLTTCCPVLYLEVQSQMRCIPTQLGLQPHTSLSQLGLAIYPPFDTITSPPGLSYNLPLLTESLNKKIWITKCAGMSSSKLAH